jgi:lysophospholipase L1-like esterase
MTGSDLSSAAGSPSPLINAKPALMACLGSSSTAGKGQAYDWIGELKRRPRNKGVAFLNFGVGGDLAYNALQRLPAVLSCHPSKVVVLIGGNDVLVLVSRKARRFFRIAKHLPSEPSPEWFRENLRAIAQRLKIEVPAAIALCSLPPIGEDPASADPFQRELNRRIEEYSASIKEIAREESVGYLPVYETMLAQIVAAPGRSCTSFRFLPFYRDAFRVLVLRKSPDEVAQLNGWRLHTDGVHLNSRGGMIVADLVQEFIDG